MKETNDNLDFFCFAFKRFHKQQLSICDYAICDKVFELMKNSIKKNNKLFFDFFKCHIM